MSILRDFNVSAAAALIAGMSALSGCMWGRVQMNDPTLRERAEKIRVGVTREKDLRGILKAEPTMRMPLKERTVLGYTYADTKTEGLMLLVVNFMKSQTAADTVYVEIGQGGAVERVSIPPKRRLAWEFWPFE